MKLKERSYPHPVLGNKDDVSGYAFQASSKIHTDRKFYYLNISFLCSSGTLNRLITNGQAGYTVHVECTNTVFRKSFYTCNNELEITIPTDDLNGSVEVNFLICAQTDISDYQIEGSHPDYAGESFRVGKGDILAVYEELNFQAEKDYDAVKKISSIMQLERSPNPQSKAMEVDFDADHIRIFLPDKDYDLYNHLKKVPNLQDALVCSIVLPVLVQAVGFLKEESDSGLEELRWFNVLKMRLRDEPVNDENDRLKAAQKVLEFPLHRTLEAAANAAYDTD